MLQTEPTYIENKDKTKTEIPPNPYLWLTRNKQDVYYQDGEYYNGRGEPPIAYNDVPTWFWIDLQNCYPPEIIKKWEIELPKKSTEEIQRLVDAGSIKMWTCDLEGCCGKEMRLTQKGPHIRKYNKEREGRELATLSQDG